MPRKSDLLHPEIAAWLSDIYRDDVALFTRYLGLRAGGPDRPPALDMRARDVSVHSPAMPVSPPEPPQMAGTGFGS